MAWSKLATRLTNLPLILAGPILRQVTKNSVTVWVALRAKADVTLTIFDKDTQATRQTLGTATRTTIAIGKLLHIVAVTARTTSSLTEGNVYFYDLQFDNVDRTLHPTLPSSPNIIQAMTRPGAVPAPHRIAYSSYTLPSFVMPPKDLNKLRLIHGSCRKPNGGTKDDPKNAETQDAMEMLDLLIGDTAESPFERPHQLLLTGDQVYADEVADVLLTCITDAGDTLFGWKEMLPGGRNSANMPYGPYEVAKLPPTTRTEAIRNAFLTSEDTRSHLMSLSEYFAMYLFAWSEELWTDLPTVDELKTIFPGLQIDAELAASIVTQRQAVLKYREALPQVRRALANIPTYMIFDDHEITDDWNMTRKFCEEVYNNALGMRIVQNGLIAYSICQHWGNAPEQFWDRTSAAGDSLLQGIQSVTHFESMGQRSYHEDFRHLPEKVGLHPASELAKQNPYGVYHDIAPFGGDPFINVEGVRVSTITILYHFTVEGPSHQIIVTDTRTWRTFPVPGKEAHPHLLGPTALERQLHTDPPPLGNRLLMIVTTTNVPPIVGIRELSYIGSAGKYYIGKKAGVYYSKVKDFIYEHDLLDSWEFPSLPFDRLIVSISNKLPAVGDTLTGQVVFLSGDIHFSFASRLAYWAEVQRFEDVAKKQKVKAVFGQLVSSSFKNEQRKTRGVQRDGYKYVPKEWLKYVSWPYDPSGYVGWNILSGSRKIGDVEAGVFVPGHTLRVDSEQPTSIAPLLASNNVTLREKPDYRYRLDYLATSQTGQTGHAASNIPPATSANRPAAVQSYAKSSRHYRDLIDRGAKLPDGIGYNNISEITFVWRRADGTPAASVNDPLATNRRVRQTVRWRYPGSTTPYWASYDVSLMIDDPNYLQLRADEEP